MMEKRRVIILTMIAVITLLSVVGGATYAYFTYTATINSSTNTLTSKTGSVGNVTLTATTPALYIGTKAVDFKEGTTGTFWSGITAGSYDTSETKRTINTLKATGGASNTIYDCTYTLSVTTTGLPSSGMKTGEYVVYIAGISNITLDMGTVANRNKAYTVHRYLTGTTGKTLTASAKLVSTNSAQNYLQGLTIETEFTTSNLNCVPASSAGTDSMTETQMALLPSAYQEVEYIESSGVERIIFSGIAANYVIYDDVAFNSASTRQLLPLASGGTLTAGTYWGSSASNYYEVGPAAGNIMSISSLNRNVVKISHDGSKIAIETNGVLRERLGTTTNFAYYLFGTDSFNASLKRYGTLIFDNNRVLKANLVPCYRISDNEIGLYDMVGEQFYKNTGTGTFSKGANIPNRYHETA